MILVSFFVLIVMTIINWSRNRNIIFLTLLLTSINLFAILHYWLVIDFNEIMVAILSNHFTPLYLLTGPFLYFYIRGVINDDFIWKRTDWIHLIPAAIQLLLILPYTFGYSFDEKVELMMDLYSNPSVYLDNYFNPLFNAIQSGLIRFISLGFYLVLSFSIVINYFIKSTRSIIFSFERYLILRWIIYLHISLILILCLYIYLIYQSNLDFSFALTSKSSMIQVSIAFLITINNLSLLFLPEIMFGLIIPKMPIRSIENKSETSNNNLNTTPIKDVEYLDKISNSVDSIMRKNKPFLHQDFKISHLADAVEVPEHHLSSCLRNIKETTFTDLKNSYRIEFFKSRVKNGDLKHLTVDALREECGFRSKSSFYSAFNKYEGTTPSEYISKISSVLEN